MTEKMYRPLSNAEKERYETVLKEEKETLQMLSWDRRNLDGLLEMGLYAQYLSDRRKVTANLKQVLKRIEESSFVISDAESKLLNGVEIKEATDSEDEE